MKKRFLLITAALIIAFALAGCGASGGYSSAKEDSYIAETSAASSYYSGNSGLAGGAVYDDYDAAPEYEEGYYEEETAAQTAASGNGERNDSDAIDKADSLEKLVYRSSLKIETTEYAETIKAIEAKISEFSGIIQSREETDSNSQWYYHDYVKNSGTLYSYITVRIPSASYRAFLDSLDGVGKMVRKSESVENISRTYADTTATIEALKTQQERLLEMLKNADTVEDMIYIEERLSEVEADLNYYNSYRSSMDTDVEYSTINIEVQEVVEYSSDKEPVKTSTFGDRLKNTLSGAWDTFKDALEVILNVIIYTFPFFFASGIIFLVVMLIIRGARRKKRARAAAKAQEQQK